MTRQSYYFNIPNFVHYKFSYIPNVCKLKNNTMPWVFLNLSAFNFRSSLCWKMQPANGIIMLGEIFRVVLSNNSWDYSLEWLRFLTLVFCQSAQAGVLQLIGSAEPVCTGFSSLAQFTALMCASVAAQGCCLPLRLSQLTLSPVLSMG